MQYVYDVHVYVSSCRNYPQTIPTETLYYLLEEHQFPERKTKHSYRMVKCVSIEYTMGKRIPKKRKSSR